MPKPLLRVREKTKDSISWAWLKNDAAAILDCPCTTLQSFLLENRGNLSNIPVAYAVTLDEIEVLSPVTEPCQIICQGKNYLDHLKETGLTEKDKDFNLLFQKAHSSLAPPHAHVKRPARVKLLDYEIELGLVLGKSITSAQTITKENLPEFVAGIVIANDISARDVQIPERQWFKGKSYRGFCPVGPYLVLLEPKDFPLLYNLDLELKVNGKTRQKSNTKLMIYKPEETLSEISEIFDLNVGDLVLTGTPGGVSMRVAKKNRWQEILATFSSEKEKFQQFIADQEKSGRYLNSGDVVTSQIKSAGGELDLGAQRITIQ